MALVSMTPMETSAMLEEVRKNGFDPAKVVCCVPSSGLPGSVKGVLGCNQADVCEFHLTRFGGFRNRTWRPKDVAVYIKPDRDMPNQNQVVLSCVAYCQRMLDRKYDAERDARRYGWGEEIRIVAHEPCAAAPKYTDEELQKLAPGTLCPACGLCHWYTEIQNVIDKPGNPNGVPVEKVVVRVVPEFKHPSQLAGTLGQRLMEGAMKDATAGEEETGPPQRMQRDESWESEEAATVAKGKK